MRQIPVSHSFSFSQSFRRENQKPSPDEFPMYSETFSLSRVPIEKSKQVRVSRPLILPYFFRSKLALDNPVNLAFIFADSLEDSLSDGFNKLVDANEGKLNQVIAPGEPIPEIPDHPMQKGFPYRVAYQGVPEYSDYPDMLEANYFHASASKLVLPSNLAAQVANIYVIQAGSFSSNEDILFQNPNQYSHLYIVPYLPKIQMTEVGVAGRCNFQLEY
ncbi:hypothetical protein [Leptospira ilyithenensis]|uniref:Uncharacterized protein n=1 Tax=Leptospira ilyithenensis TaxID=2484901 RepID=A0A4R9LS95_9LEPT|nr:hypothetical protein [Leptospira ilyithenensis]TGN09766.1 hypothetical protein EHS11_11835 [Leptospira ilyithenensis]